ncbi:MAG TPA: proton-conducting transporter membrane subunit [Candidatus Bathyarchaeia archaeon]|nr:proton-conducting transporter membrane subunit [Candidatus Bathyarchaeia archaeon]
MAEISVNFLILSTIFLPFIMAIFIIGLKKWLKGFSGEIAAGGIIANIMILAALYYRIKNGSGALFGFYKTVLGAEFSAPSGVQFKVDGFTSIFLLVLNIIVVLILFYESVKQRGKAEGPIYIGLILFLVTGINASVLANDFFTTLLGWIIIGISLITLIAFQKRQEDLREGGMRAFILISLSVVFILTAVILCYGLFGTLNYDYIHDDVVLLNSERITTDAKAIIYLIIALTIVGFGLLANIFMLNLWMPNAIEKSSASTQVFSVGIVSGLALLSIFKVLFSFFDTTQMTIINYPLILAIIGLMTALEGVLVLVYQVTRKDKENITLSKIIIYTIFVNIGVILTGISIGGMVNSGTEETLFSVKECFGYSILQIINIGITSFLAFIAKDNLMIKRNRSEKLIDLRGVGREYPLTTFNLIVGLASMIGLLPMFGGVNLYMLLFTLIQLNYISYTIIIIFILVLMLISYLVVIKYLLFDKPDQDSTLISGGLSQDVSMTSIIGTIVALGLIILGLIPSLIGKSIIENAYLLIP